MMYYTAWLLPKEMTQVFEILPHGRTKTIVADDLATLDVKSSANYDTDKSLPRVILALHSEILNDKLS